jgi:hypothetical protein
MAPLRPQGIDPLGGTPEEFARYIAAETQNGSTWRRRRD